MTKENNIRWTSLAIILLSILIVGLQYSGYQVKNIFAGTVMLNLNIFVSMVLVILLIKRLILIIKNKKIRLLPAFLSGLMAIGMVAFEPFNYTGRSILPDTIGTELKTDTVEIKNGDLIFQTSLSGQSKAIQLATGSRYSHCGIIYKEGNDIYVFEAVQPVKRTPLEKWIARGENGRYVIKRLKNAGRVLTPETLRKMKQIGETFTGKNYDLTFEWSDDKIYCSELIWKIYQRATGLEIGKLEKLSDFDLGSEAVKKKMKERYGDKIPMDEIVISPAAIFDSELLMTVKSN